MNYPMVTLHWIGMFLSVAGGVMLAVWLFKNLKPATLLTVILIAIVLGLAVSYLTFSYETQFFSALLGGKL